MVKSIAIPGALVLGLLIVLAGLEAFCGFLGVPYKSKYESSEYATAQFDGELGVVLFTQ